VIDDDFIDPVKELIENISFNCSKGLLTAIIEFFTVYFQQNGYSQLFFENDIISILMKLAFIDETSYMIMNGIRRLVALSQNELPRAYRIQIMEKLISQGLLHRMFHLLKTRNPSNPEKTDIRTFNSVMHLLLRFSQLTITFRRLVIDYSFLPIFHGILSYNQLLLYDNVQTALSISLDILRYLIKCDDDAIIRILINGFFLY
jgi:hypothetical protein